MRPPAVWMDLAQIRRGSPLCTTRLANQLHYPNAQTSHCHLATVLKQCEDSVQFLDRPFQLPNRIRRQFLRRRQFVGIFQTVVLEPLEAVELEVTGLYVRNREA